MPGNRHKMIGIIYTGESEDTLMDEVCTLQGLNIKEQRIFVEPSMESEFRKYTLCPYESFHGARYMGVPITNIEKHKNI